jgi:small subunit ribosomal protein S6e
VRLTIRALFYDKQMGDEVEGDLIGDEFKGYVFKISGGQDHQGFAMIQGVFANERVRLLMRECHKCFNIRRKGYKKKKSVRGCIVGPDIKILHLVIVIKGEADIPELTDKMESKRLGPKRASKIAQLFSIEKANYASNNYKGKARHPTNRSRLLQGHLRCRGQEAVHHHQGR